MKFFLFSLLLVFAISAPAKAQCVCGGNGYAAEYPDFLFEEELGSTSFSYNGAPYAYVYRPPFVVRRYAWTRPYVQYPIRSYRYRYEGRY
jgi:hypothetical protein